MSEGVAVMNGIQIWLWWTRRYFWDYVLPGWALGISVPVIVGTLIGVDSFAVKVALLWAGSLIGASVGCYLAIRRGELVEEGQGDAWRGE